MTGARSSLIRIVRFAFIAALATSQVGCLQGTCGGGSDELLPVEGEYWFTPPGSARGTIVDAVVTVEGETVVVEYEKADGTHWRATYEITVRETSGL
jgi:hypothetical protein